MARAPKSNRFTTAPFVPPDDDCIGPKSDWDQYLDTQNEKHLDLTGEPDRFHVKRMGLRQYFRFLEVLNIVSEDQDDAPPEMTAAQLAALVKRVESVTEFNHMVIEQLVMGFDRYWYVTGFNGHGEPEVESFTLEIGEEKSEEMTTFLIEDAVLMNAIFTFSMKLAGLSLDEKKDSDSPPE